MKGQVRFNFNYSHYVLLLLWLVALFRLIDLQIIAVLLESIRAEMGFSDTQLGLLSGLAFALFYSVLGIPVAWLADRHSRRNILSCCLGLWSLMTALCGFASSFLQFFLARMGVGVGEAGGYPPSTSLLADYFPPRQRAFVFAVLGSAIPVGVFFAFIVGGLINQHFGWRVAYLAVGIPGIVLALLVRLTLKEPRRGAAEGLPAQDETGESLATTFKRLFNSPGFCLVVAGAAFYAMAATGSGIWMPSFFMRVHGMSSAEVGTWMGCMYGAGGLTGTLLGGIVADRLVNRHASIRYYMRVCSVSMIALLPLVGIVFTTRHLSLALGVHFFVIILMHVSVGPTLALIQHLAGVPRRAQAQAVNVLMSNLIGLSLGPLLVGMFSDRFSPIAGDLALGYGILGIYLIGYSLAALCYWLAERARGGVGRLALSPV